MKPPITNKGKSTLSMRYPFGLNGMFASANKPINQAKTVNAIADHIIIPPRVVSIVNPLTNKMPLYG